MTTAREIRLVGVISIAMLPGLAAGQPTLVNAGAEAGINVAHEPDVNMVTSEGWMHGGVAVGDFNNSGYPDFYVPVGGLSPDALYINNGDGTFTNQADSWGIAVRVGSTGAAVGDVNNNGWLDLYVTSFSPAGAHAAPGNHRLYQNNGDQTFTNVAEQAGVNATTVDWPNGYGAAFGDYNLNGHLDLFVCSWRDSQPVPGETNQGTGNRLFKNNGDGTFTDVTSDAIGQTALQGVWGFQPAFVDMNHNGFPEILISADFTTSRYLKNNGDGTFTNITEQSGTGIDKNGMGQAVGDLDNNGLFDWYVTSIFVTSNNPPKNNGNMLYMNQGNHEYIEMGAEMGVANGYWGWGTLAIDLDNNGWLDLLEVNGRPTTNWINKPALLFYNNGDGTFTEMAEEAGFDQIGEGRSLAWLDVERNGRLDFLVGQFQDDLLYYRNDTFDGGNWLRLTFDSSTNPLIAPNGFGVLATAFVGELQYVQYLSGSPSYLSTSELAIHFGLADAQTVDELIIRWPRGYETILHNVDVNQYLEIQAPVLADLTGSGSIGVDDLLIVLNNWGPCETVCLADMTNEGSVGVDDLLIVLNNWGPVGR